MVLVALFLVTFALAGGAGIAITSSSDVVARQPASSHALIGAGATAALGYLSFWLWFISPDVGWVSSWVLLAIAAAVGVRRSRALWATVSSREVRIPLALALLVALAYVGILLWYRTPLRIDNTAATRFIPDGPVDNEIPRIFAERLRDGTDAHHLLPGWQSSDRPPLQTGLILLFWPVLRALGFAWNTSAFVVGVWAQCTWVLAVWAMARRAMLSRAATIAAVVAVGSNVAIAGYSVYVWPKLIGAALTIGAVLVYLDATDPDREVRPGERSTIALAAGLAALGYLCHPGVSIAMVGVGVAVVLLRRLPSLRSLAIGAGVFVSVNLPWILYQRIYDPPGDRLLAVHFAGVDDPDGAAKPNLLRLIASAYRSAGIDRVASNKWSNVRMLGRGSFDCWWDGNARCLWERRGGSFYFFAFGFGYWLVPLAVWGAVAVAVWIRRRTGPSPDARFTVLAVAASLLFWTLSMFGPDATVNHHGTITLNLVIATAAFVIAWRWNRWVALALTALSVGMFLYTTIPTLAPTAAPIDRWSVALLVGAGLGMVVLAGDAALGERDETGGSVPRRQVGAVVAPWQRGQRRSSVPTVAEHDAADRVAEDA